MSEVKGGAGGGASRPPLPRRMVLVDDKGQLVRTGSDSAHEQAAPAPTVDSGAAAAQDLRERSVNLWKVINPGCMRTYLQTPWTTSQEHFIYRSDLVPPVDKTHHFQKNAFSEHTEEGLGVMKALISDKK